MFARFVTSGGMGGGRDDTVVLDDAEPGLFSPRSEASTVLDFDSDTSRTSSATSVDSFVNTASTVTTVSTCPSGSVSVGEGCLLRCALTDITNVRKRLRDANSTVDGCKKVKPSSVSEDAITAPSTPNITSAGIIVTNTDGEDVPSLSVDTDDSKETTQPTPSASSTLQRCATDALTPAFQPTAATAVVESSQHEFSPIYSLHQWHVPNSRHAVDVDYFHVMLAAESRLQVFNPDAPYVRYRPYLVDWLVTTGTQTLQLQLLTTRSALALLDYTLTTQPHVPKHHWELIGLVSLLLASKFYENDDRVPKLSTLKGLCHCAYTSNQLAYYECKLLQLLDWRISTVTTQHFVSYYYNNAVTTTSSDRRLIECIEYLNELILFDYCACQFYRPSLVAESLIQAAREMSGDSADSPVLFNYDSNEVRACAQRIIQCAHAAQWRDRQATTEK